MEDEQQIKHDGGGGGENTQNGGYEVTNPGNPQGGISNHDEVEGKIFVGGLSWQTTEESMRFHFEKFGELSDIAIMIDKRTGQPR